MNAKQAARVEAFRDQILKAKYGHTAASYEIKQFKVTEYDADTPIYLVCETGLIGDEGTAASILCRDYRLISIGVLGGCELMNPKVKGRTINRGMWHCLHNLTAY